MESEKSIFKAKDILVFGEKEPIFLQVEARRIEKVSQKHTF